MTPRDDETRIAEAETRLSSSDPSSGKPPSHVVWKHVLLFLLTVATTTLAGTGHYAAFLSEFGAKSVPLSWSVVAGGLWYSVSVILILGAHEMGHYLTCRWYRVDATLPFFLPFPPLPGVGQNLTGTLGAVIRIREAFPTKATLFDIGVAGPIAGFLVLVPTLFLGVSMSTIVPEPQVQSGLIYLGEPLLFRGATWAVFGSVAKGYTLNMHPMVMASWFGMISAKASGR